MSKTLQNRSGEPSETKKYAAKIVFFIFLIIAWQLFYLTKFFPPYLFPGPVEVFGKLIYLVKEGLLSQAVGESLKRMFVGYSVSVVGGIAIGILAARSWMFKETVGSVILSLQSLPSICWLPFAIIWIGLNDKAILAVLILGALFSIAVATEGAIRNIPPIYLKVGRVLGARRFVMAKDVLFFAALPELIGGLKLGWTFAWRSLMAAELIRSDIIGVGYLLEQGRNNNDVALMMASIFTILAIGLLVDGLVFGSLEKKIRRRYGLTR